MTSFFFPGKAASHTASVRRIANDATDLGHNPQLAIAEKHVNNDEKHVSSEPVVVHTQEEEKLLNDIRNSTAVIPVPASAKRLMGKRTVSQGKRGAKGDGSVYTLFDVPTRLFKPV